MGSTRKLSLILAALVCKGFSFAIGCGLGWSNPPHSHFNGVDSQGYVALVDTLGAIRLGDGVRIPLIARFKSGRNHMSPYAGSGWDIPLLESRLIQVEENLFRCEQPDGWMRMFWRDAKEPSLLHGQGGWKAEIQGNSVTIWASCGSKLSYQNGRLVSMETQKRRFDFVYAGNRIVQIRTGDSPVLDVLFERGTENVQGFALAGGETVHIEKSQRPLVAVVEGKNLITQVEDSLSAFANSDRSRTANITYPLDEELNPAIQFDGRLVKWNPASGRVVQDGDWAYTIAAGKGKFDYAAISRRNPEGREELWHDDTGKGIETILGADGVKRITRRFTSGKLAGSVRSKEEIAGGVSKMVYQATYDEKGNLFREILADGSVTQLLYDEKGERSRQQFSREGELQHTTQFSGKNVSTIHSRDGRVLSYQYDDSNRVTKTFINGKLQSDKSYAQDGSWEKEIVFDDGSPVPSRTFRREFDAAGRTLIDTISEHAGDYPEIIRRYSYDDFGRLTEVIDSQQGTIRYIQEAGQTVAKVVQSL